MTTAHPLTASRSLLAALSLALLLTMTFPLAAAPAYELPKGITVAVESGAGGVLHLGRNNPVSVFVENKGDSGVFDCEVSILTDDATYTRNLQVAAGDTMSTVLLVDLDPPPTFAQVTVKTRLGKIIFGEKLDLSNAAAPEDPLVLVVDDQPGRLSFMEGSPILNRKRGMANLQGDDLTSGKML